MSTALHTNCIICSNAKIKAISGYEKDHLFNCSNCGFVFCSQIPSHEELEAYYSDNYDRTKFFSPITRKRYNELLDKFEKNRKTNRILDLGCGYGFFLEVAKERGWDVYGAEISDEAVKVCKEKGINMFHGNAKDADFELDSFDVIVSIEVIEHLIDPNSFLQKANALLRKGGMMYVTTPNFNSYLRYRLKGEYDVIEYPNHLLYFTNKTLKRIFEKHHFQTKRVEVTGISMTRLRTSKQKSNQDFVSETSDDEMLRHKIEKNKGLKAFKLLTNKVLSTFKVGVTLKGTFIKS